VLKDGQGPALEGIQTQGWECLSPRNIVGNIILLEGRLVVGGLRFGTRHSPSRTKANTSLLLSMQIPSTMGNFAQLPVVETGASSIGQHDLQLEADVDFVGPITVEQINNTNFSLPCILDNIGD